MQRFLRLFFTLIFLFQLPVCLGATSFKDAHVKRLVASVCLVAGIAAVDIALQSDREIIEASDSALDTRAAFKKWGDRASAVFSMKNWASLSKEVAKVLWPKKNEKRWLPVRAFAFARNHTLFSAAVGLSMANAVVSLYQMYAQRSPAVVEVEPKVPQVVLLSDATVPQESMLSPMPTVQPQKMLKRKIKRKSRVLPKYIVALKKLKKRKRQHKQLVEEAEAVRPAGPFSSQSMGRKASIFDGGYVVPDDMLDGIVRPWSANGREKHLTIPSSRELQRSGSPWNLEVVSSDDESDEELLSFEAAAPRDLVIQKTIAQKSVVERTVVPDKAESIPFKPLQVRVDVDFKRPPRPATTSRARLSAENVAPRGGIGSGKRATSPAFGSTASRFSNPAVISF